MKWYHYNSTHDAFRSIQKKFMLVFVLLVLELLFFFGGYDIIGPHFDNQRMCTEHETPLLNDLSKEYAQEPFRIHFENIKGIGRSTQYATLPQGLDIMYGHYGGLWVPEYLNVHLSLALRDPARQWGILNVKYVVSPEEINISGLTLKKTYGGCETCFRSEINGPFLYENEYVLPRVYETDTAVLVAGDQAKELMYSLLLHPTLNASQRIIVVANGPLSSYTDEELSAYEMLILTENAVARTDFPRLKQYAEQGGEVLPNIFEEEQSVSPEILLARVQKVQGNITPLSFTQTPNTFSINASGGQFVVISEKLWMFPGWSEHAHRAQGIITAIPNQERKLFLKYAPESFSKGGKLSFVALLLGLLLLWWSK